MGTFAGGSASRSPLSSSGLARDRRPPRLPRLPRHPNSGARHSSTPTLARSRRTGTSTQLPAHAEQVSPFQQARPPRSLGLQRGTHGREALRVDASSRSSLTACPGIVAWHSLQSSASRIISSGGLPSRLARRFLIITGTPGLAPRCSSPQRCPSPSLAYRPCRPRRRPGRAFAPASCRLSS